ncbi:MAG: 1,4-alpha-glucan branching protein GlgB [Eubacteriales bacterium]
MIKQKQNTLGEKPFAESRGDVSDKTAEYLFHQGTNFKSYDYFGCHKTEGGFVFRTWAPGADMVYLAGDFNGWDTSCQMEKTTENGVWAVFLDKNSAFAEKKDGERRYKFLIKRGEKLVYKADPYAFYSETKLNTASLFYSLDGYEWSEDEYNYLASRKTLAASLSRDVPPPYPINIYEVHLGSWKRGEDGGYLSYSALAGELSEYLREMGYTHIEILPVAEHPFDGSWGYQTCGYFAPTSRFGTPEDFMAFVETFHKKGIGVILDWVPSHFPKDIHGLFEFDGSPLYEYQGSDRMEHKGWGTRAFDVGRNEIRSFLISNALFWLDKYHIDGLRVDAVASMLYLDYGREPGEWNPNPDGGNINIQSVSFFKDLNKAVKKSFPDALMIAEESTAYPYVTKSRGLGFNLKWNMGWMNDALSYIGSDFNSRPHIHNTMTFSTAYAFSENYINPISHDEVVHGKKSLIDKMFGSYDQKFSGMKTFLAWMYAHPGKKLLFMGSEFAQFREWDYESGLEWFMLNYPAHKDMREYVKSLNFFYKETPELFELDGDSSGFLWLDADSREDSLFAFERVSEKGGRVVCAFNFSPINKKYIFPVSQPGIYREVFATSPAFGAKGKTVKPLAAELRGEGEKPLLTLEMPPLSAFFLKITSKAKTKAKEKPNPETARERKK